MGCVATSFPLSYSFTRDASSLRLGIHRDRELALRAGFQVVIRAARESISCISSPS